MASNVIGAGEERQRGGANIGTRVHHVVLLYERFHGSQWLGHGRRGYWGPIAMKENVTQSPKKALTKNKGDYLFAPRRPFFHSEDCSSTRNRYLVVAAHACGARLRRTRCGCR